MRALLAAVLLAALLLAGCAGPSGNPNLRPPCADSQPVRIEVASDKERYFPGEVMNVTLLLNSTAGSAQTFRYKAWELSLRSFDGRFIRTYVREVDPDLGGGSKNAPANGRVVLQERWPAFRVTSELFEPLTPGTYYLCAVLTGLDGATLATGARPFIAERVPQPVT